MSEPAETALGRLTEYGILGSFSVLLIVALVWAIRGWLREKDNRFNDQKAMAEARQKDNDALRLLTIELKEHSTQLVMDAKSAHDLTANALARQEGALDDQSRAITALKDEQVRMTTAFGALKDETIRLASQLSTKRGRAEP